jgi:glycosyltransferase involved in cell wall biosynthesis
MKFNNDTLVSVLTVVENDASIATAFVEETSRVMSENYRYYELVIVDNNSSDGSDFLIQTLQKSIPNVRLLRLSRTHDVEIAITAGLDNCVGDYVVVLNPRYDPSDLIPEMLEKAISGYDVVIAERECRNDQPFLQRQLAVLFYRIASRLLGYPLQPNATHFRVFSRQVVNSISRIGNKNRYLKYLNALVGFKQTHITYQRKYRGELRRDEGILRSMVAGVDLIISNSAVPLRIASLLGFCSSALSLLYTGYVLVITLVKQKIAEGWITTNLMNSTMFFLLFLILTILSEYVARILDEARERPLYFVAYETHSIVSTFSVEKKSKAVNVV